MLKLKDELDKEELKEELDEIGFIYYDDKHSSYYGCYMCEEGRTTIFINTCGYISISSDKVIFELDTLYELIRADLVEEVEE